MSNTRSTGFIRVRRRRRGRPAVAQGVPKVHRGQHRHRGHHGRQQQPVPLRAPGSPGHHGDPAQPGADRVRHRQAEEDRRRVVQGHPPGLRPVLQRAPGQGAEPDHLERPEPVSGMTR